MNTRNPNAYRLNISVAPEIKPALKELSKRWHCKTNEAAARSILESLHRPLTSPSEPIWASEIKAEVRLLHEDLMEIFS